MVSTLVVKVEADVRGIVVECDEATGARQGECKKSKSRGVAIYTDITYG